MTEVVDLEDPELTELHKSFEAKMRELGIGTKLLHEIRDTGDLSPRMEKKRAKKKKELDRLFSEFKEGKQLDPDFYPRDAKGKFTAPNAHTWKKGMKSPNPLGKPRAKTNLWPRFCQIMEMTHEEFNRLIKRKDLRMVDRVAIRMTQQVVITGLWPQTLEIIQREEGKVAEKVQVEAVPQPIRFVEVPDREQTPEVVEGEVKEIKLLEDSEKGNGAKQLSLGLTLEAEDAGALEAGKPSDLSDKDGAEAEELWK